MGTIPSVCPCPETGNKTDVRWVALRNKAGEGLLITGEEPLNVSAWNFPLEDIDYVAFNTERRHGGSIMKKDMIWLNIDHRHMGVGGDNTGERKYIRNIPSLRTNGNTALPCNL